MRGIPMLKYNTNQAWIGVDLDGTWAYYEQMPADRSIGEPISLMTKKVKLYLDTGITVKVFTARVASTVPFEERENQKQKIRDWTTTVVGQALESTAEKDYDCVKILDDRAEQIMINTGLSLKEFMEVKVANLLREQ